MATAETLTSLRVVDVDSHLIEPPDLWTARLPIEKWGEDVPHVRADWKGAKGLNWYIGDWRVSQAPGAGASAAWAKNNPDYLPATPASFEDIHPAAYDPRARLDWMDQAGIYAQVIYPNVAGFAAGALLRIRDPKLRLECVRTYNDFLVEWCTPGKGRLIPLALLPFWDIDETVKEAQRAVKMGHKGLLMSNMPHTLKQPPLSHPHWYHLWAAAQDLDVPINFHIGSGDRDRERERKLRSGEIQLDAFGGDMTIWPGNGEHANHVHQGVVLFLDNVKAITEVLVSAICHKFPRLKLVSVESGAGWIPFVCEALDWQWVASGGAAEHPEYELKPSELFKRQWYACFWFEKHAIKSMMEFAPDNVMFETDFPHPTSLTPGPLSPSPRPKDHIAEVFRYLPDEWARKACSSNASRLYKVL